jgi:predicted short-subunit dehydrogenase-like oxidoreductase (DUF2520 family)
MNQAAGFVSIGAGNVSTHFVRKLCDSGFKLVQVYSRTADSAWALAEKYNAGFTNSADEIVKDASFYLVSLPDQVLPGFLEHFKIKDKLIVHTAGSYGIDVFGEEYRYFGVLYPLQTFSKKFDLDISVVPILIEACDNETLKEIEKIARVISDKVIETDAETRRWIHLSALFASNFTNHMYVLAEELMKSRNLDPDILNPLIEETFRKSRLMDPAEAQTGPAVRNDVNTLAKHIKMLENKPLLQKIYTFTSESIQFTKSSKQNKPVNE